MTTITGRPNSVPSTMYRLEFFADDAIDTTGYVEGKTFIGSKDVTTDAGGNINFRTSSPQIGTG